MKISVAIVTRDKNKILPKCLETAGLVSDDVVIVTGDDHKFVDFSDQKNYAASICKNDWILSLDDDEWLSTELISEINNLSGEFSAYKIPRLNYIFGKEIKYSNWDPRTDTHIWLFDRRVSKWVGVVHEDIETRGKIGQLSGNKIHSNYSTVEQFVSKLNQYTTLEAVKSPRPLWWLPFYPVWKFIRHYFIYFGFLDGWHGFYLSYLQAIYGLVVVIKSWQRKNI